MYPLVKDHLQSRWWFPGQKAFKGVTFELIFYLINDLRYFFTFLELNNDDFKLIY